MEIQPAKIRPILTQWKILVVDPHEEGFQNIRGMLQEARGQAYDLRWSTTFEAGQLALSEDIFNAILVDYDLGEHSGIDFIREANALGCDSPLILFSDQENYALDIEATQAGAALYLNPHEVSPQLLERIIRYAIELKEKEHALRVSEERFRLASRAVHGVLYDWSVDREEVYQSEGLEQIVGYRPGEEPSKNKHWWPDNIHPEDFPRIHRELQAAIEGRTNAFAYEYRIRHKDGHWVDIWDHGYIVRDEKGQAQRVVGMCTDITGRKQAEAKLLESENRFRVALASAPISVYTTDCDLCLTWMYDPTPGFQPEAVIGLRLDQLIPGRTGEELMAIQRKVIDTGQAQQGEIDAWSEGKLTAYNYYIDPITDAAGKIVGLACAGYDITGRKMAENKLQHYAKELERSNQALQDFAFIASHDLQEPLRKIILFGSRLQEIFSGLMNEEARDYLARMNNAAKRMQTMINGLLELSRVSTRGKLFTSIDLNQVIEEVLSDLDTRIQEAGGQVEVAELPHVDGDEGQMRQLFQNLILNAIKYHKPNTPPLVRVTCTIDQAVQPPTVAVHVADNGIGFDQRDAEQIFQPFQRLHGRHEYEGTGLGLSICQKIIERHNGKIEVTSAPGQGATFTVYLRLRAD